MKYTLPAALLLAFASSARADILQRTDNTLLAGKLLSISSTEAVLQTDKTQPIRIPRDQIKSILPTDDHGALLHTDTQPARTFPAPPPEPTSPPLDIITPTGPTFYVIPLHGEVGATILASALEKSLADAALRQPTVVVLDISSPGGLVEEAGKILKVLHQYNRQFRIVALADQDLSAAAIITLSVREIYVKPGSTIGAAVSFVPTKLFLPPKLEEKFQSAWRAVARSSADEGRHNPLLADAMIDPSYDLRIITIDGKPTVVEAPPLAEKPQFLRKGKILTMTAREAVACGLAAGEAEDLDDLARQLHLSPWTECKGLARPLADYIPKRAALFKSEIDKISASLADNLLKAQRADPTHSFHIDINTGKRQPPASPPEAPITDRTQWEQRALQCVIALQSAEQDLRDAITVCNAFDQQTTAESLSALLEKISDIRALIFDKRTHVGEVAAAPAAPTPINPAPTPAPARTANSGPPLPVTSLTEAEAALANGNEDDQSRAARFLTSAPINPAERAKITPLLLPLVQRPDSIKNYVYMEAFTRWADTPDVPALVAILSNPAASAANPNPQNRYWPAAITALIRLDPAAAEPILQQRKSEFYFRTKITFALQTLVKANGPEKPAAQHLLDILSVRK